MTRQETYVRAYCPTYDTTFNITGADMARDCTWLFTGWLRLSDDDVTQIIWTTFAEAQLRDFESSDKICSAVGYQELICE